MPRRVIRGLDELKQLVGQEIGHSEWVRVTQERVDAFADGTGDHQWIHCDPERAREESPFGMTIAHGFLTLSLAPALAQEIFDVEGVRFVLNYGLNRVRFPNAVQVGSRVRMRSELAGLKDVIGGAQCTFKMTVEIEGQDRPACVAEMVMRLYFDENPLEAIRQRRAAAAGKSGN